MPPDLELKSISSVPVPDRPSVGVIIAAYKARDSIGVAVRSALAESDVHEVWVVDDASPDDTVEQALAADDGSGRLRLLRQAINQGPAAARNRALQASRADWVCVLDSDDYFLPGRIRALLERAEHSDLVADELIRVNAADEVPVWSSDARRGPSRPITLAEFVDGNVSRKDAHRQELGFIKPLMRRTFLTQHKLTYDVTLRLGEDYVLYAQALVYGARLILAPPQGYVAVIRPDSLSGRHSIGDLIALRDRDRRIAHVRITNAKERRAFDAHYVSLDKRVQWRRLIEAVKARSMGDIVSTFTSIPVTVFLIRQLVGQFIVRSGLIRGPS